MKKYLGFILGFILAISLLWPLVTAPYFSMHDDVQAIRLFEMDKCIKDGQIPCRWVPDLGGSYGYPLFNYYAPLAYYVGEVFYLITNNLLLSAKLMFGFSFLGAYVFMYLFSRKLWGDLGGVASAVFYSFAPYHALVFFVRGAMGEMWSLMFFPAILWAVIRLKESTKIANVLLLAIFICGLILSHNIGSMIFLPVFFVFTLMLFWQKRDLNFLRLSTLAVILGLCLSAFYWLPMLVEKPLVHVETTVEGYFSYTEHFKGFRKLFLDNSWGWGDSVREVPGGAKDGMSFQIGWVHILAWFIALFGIKYFWKKNRQISISIIFFSLVASASIIMINPRSDFIWRMFDPLKYLQFPWRFLMLVIFSISVLVGSVVLMVPSRFKLLVAGLLIVLVSVTNFSYFKPEKFINITDQEFLTGKSWNKQVQRSIYDFLPIFAKEPPAEPHPERYKLLVGDTIIKDYKEGTNWFDFKTETKNHTIILLSKYYFPDWKVLVDGKEVKIDYKNNHLGLMYVILGSGSHYVEGRLYDTPIRSSGNLISILGLIVFSLLLIIQIPRVRRSFSYYLKGLYK